MTYKNASIRTISEMNAYQLTNGGGCLNPDDFTSPGAEFLTGIRDAVVEALTEFHIEGTDDTYTLVADGIRDERAHEIADGAVPIYTHTMWATFTDLGGWEQDIDEMGELTDMNGGATTALYLIARNLVETLLSQVEDDEDDEDDETCGTCGEPLADSEGEGYNGECGTCADKTSSGDPL